MSKNKSDCKEVCVSVCLCGWTHGSHRSMCPSFIVWSVRVLLCVCVCMSVCLPLCGWVGVAVCGGMGWVCVCGWVLRTRAPGHAAATPPDAPL